MNSPWMALVLPVFAFQALLSFLIMPGILFSGEHKASYKGVVRWFQTLFDKHYRIALAVALPCLVLIFLECLFGRYQSGRTPEKDGLPVMPRPSWASF